MRKTVYIDNMERAYIDNLERTSVDNGESACIENVDIVYIVDVGKILDDIAVRSLTPCGNYHILAMCTAPIPHIDDDCNVNAGCVVGSDIAG